MRLVAKRLHEGGVIAYPTEGVWGLGCMPDQPAAVARILALKARSWEQGLILVAGELAQMEPYLHAIGDTERSQLIDAWPGPVTFIVPDAQAAPEWIRGKHETVALRVSSHPVIRAICAAVGPIVSTSANPSGRPPAKSLLRLRQYFPEGPEGIDLIVPGALGGTRGPTEIRELGSGRIQRASPK
jgi:L-threonylcarbamoyladenylate synthase